MSSFRLVFQTVTVFLFPTEPRTVLRNVTYCHKWSPARPRLGWESLWGRRVSGSGGSHWPPWSSSATDPTRPGDSRTRTGWTEGCWGNQRGGTVIILKFLYRKKTAQKEKNGSFKSTIQLKYAVNERTPSRIRPAPNERTVYYWKP